MLNFAFVLALSLILLHNVRANCHVCNSNGVACISDQEFHICVKGEVNTSVTFSCLGENEICTDSDTVCENILLNSASRGCLKYSYGKCDGKRDDGKFSCTSRTTFAMCSDGNLTQIDASCPDNYICDMDLSRKFMYPCVRRREKPRFQESILIDPAAYFCSKVPKEGHYPYPDDLTLKRCLECYRVNGVMVYRVVTCEKGPNAVAKFLSDLFFSPYNNFVKNFA